MVEGGAFLDALTTSVVIIRAASEAEARAVMESDVYVPNGIWTDISVRPWGRVAN